MRNRAQSSYIKFIEGMGANYRKKANFVKNVLKFCVFFKKLSKLAKKITNYCFSLKHCGGILIEFAFSIPVLVILLYSINDHYVFNDCKNKIRSSAYLAASMIQQVSNNRANKKLTADDLGRISWCCFYNFFHNRDEMTAVKKGIRPVMFYVYVKRINSNSYSYQWIFWNTDTYRDKCQDRDSATKTLADIRKLSPDLECNNDGDERLLIWPIYRPLKDYFNKAKLGLFILPIKAIDGVTVDDPTIESEWLQATETCFNFRLVITPKPGLFPID